MGEVVLIVPVRRHSARIVTHCHGEPASPQSDSGSDHLQASGLPLEEIKLRVDECVPQGKKHTPNPSLVAVLPKDGVPRETE